MRRSSFAIYTLALFSLSSLVLGASPVDRCLQIYEYDGSVPPSVDQTLLSEDEHASIYRLTLHSVNGEEVPSLLSVPKRGGPHPVVILLHGYGGDKEDLMDVASPIAERGYAAASIDAQYHGERRVEGRNMYSSDSNMTIHAFSQTVIDVRRLIDHLETRPDVDASRIGLVGGSMGALLGTIVAGVDDRIDVPILVVGGGNMTIMVGNSQLSRVVEIRGELSGQGRTVEEVARELECVDPINFVSSIAPRPLLMINGRFDDIVPTASNEALYEAAEDPKKIIWYDTGHDVPTDPVVRNAFFWLERHLKKRLYLQTWFHAVVILVISLAGAIYLSLRLRIRSENRKHSH